MTIPARVYFLWIGDTLSWAYAFAVLSAAAKSEMDEIILHHTDDLKDNSPFRALKGSERIRLSRLNPAELLAEAGEAAEIEAGRLANLYDGFVSPVMRADILRVAILYLQGGIYLDLDTLIVSSLRSVLGALQFIGTEYIVWPQKIRKSRSPALWIRHLILDVVRKGLRSMPHGWKIFRHIEHLYFKGANNAAMGGKPRAPLFRAYLHEMCAQMPAGLTSPYALGPHMLQHLVDHTRWVGLVIYQPEAFFPISPQISEHLFRTRQRVHPQDVMFSDTLVVHWYASVRTHSRVALITPDYVRQHQHCQLYSALVCLCLPDIADL